MGADRSKNSDESLKLMDRRQAERAKLDGASALLMIGEMEVPSKFRDISRTGFSFTTDRRLGIGTELSFDGLLHDEGESSVFVSCCARVVRCEHLHGKMFEAGCYFTVMTDENREAIDDFVATAYGRT